MFNSSFLSGAALSIQWGCWRPHWWKEAEWICGLTGWHRLDRQGRWGWWRILWPPQVTPAFYLTTEQSRALVPNQMWLSVTDQRCRGDLSSEPASLILRGSLYLDRGHYQTCSRGPGTPRPMMRPYKRSVCWRRNWKNWELKLPRSYWLRKGARSQVPRSRFSKSPKRAPWSSIFTFSGIVYSCSCSSNRSIG